MFPLILTVLSRVGIIIRSTTLPIKDCQYEGEHPKFWGSTGLGMKSLGLGRGLGVQGFKISPESH